jgi:hypothetical protein
MGVIKSSSTKIMETLKKVWDTVFSPTTSDSKSRALFTDGVNSISHFIIGLFAVQFSILTPLFISYQLLDPSDVNIFVDINEFVLGYIVGLIFKLSTASGIA